MVGDVFGRVAGVSDPSTGQQCGGLAGDDRPSEGHRPDAGPGPAPAPGRPPPGAPRPERGGPTGRRSVGRHASATVQAARGGGVPLRRRDAIRGRGRSHRWQSGRRPASGRRRHRRTTQDLWEGRPTLMTGHEPDAPERSDLFVALPAVDEETTRRLHDRLVREAQTAGLLDVAYRTIDSPVGPLLLAATAKGLVRVAYGCEDHEKVLERLARDLSPRILHAPARLDAAAKEIDEYFAGLRQGFDLPVDWSLARGFRHLVLTCLRAIEYGQTATTRPSRSRPATLRRCTRSGPRAQPTPSPLSCPATAWCAVTGPSASTSAAPTRKRPY